MMKRLLNVAEVIMTAESCRNGIGADLLVTNGTICTSDSSLLFVDSMAIRDGRIIRIGNYSFVQVRMNVIRSLGSTDSTRGINFIFFLMKKRLESKLTDNFPSTFL